MSKKEKSNTFMNNFFWPSIIVILVVASKSYMVPLFNNFFHSFFDNVNNLNNKIQFDFIFVKPNFEKKFLDKLGAP